MPPIARRALGDFDFKGAAKGIFMRGESGAAMRSRTSNLLIRSQMLYPIELWLQRKQGAE